VGGGGQGEKEGGTRGTRVGSEGKGVGGARGKEVRKGVGRWGGEGGGGAKAFLPENISLHEGCFV
jgi:hypothetical protein